MHLVNSFHVFGQISLSIRSVIRAEGTRIGLYTGVNERMSFQLMDSWKTFIAHFAAIFSFSVDGIHVVG